MSTPTGSSGNEIEAHHDWRSLHSQKERDTVLAHLVDKLTILSCFDSKESVTERATATEAEAHSSSNSRQEYLIKIADSLVEAEQQSGNLLTPDHSEPQQTNVKQEWHLTAPQDERVNIRRHISTMIGRAFATDQLWSREQRARSFEDQAYYTSKTREDYLSAVLTYLMSVGDDAKNSGLWSSNAPMAPPYGQRCMSEQQSSTTSLDATLSPTTHSGAQDSWRSLLPREERVKICRHIMSKLCRYYPNVSEILLKQRTRSFEAKTFQSANSREEYLSNIANCLTKVEEHVNQSRAEA